MTDPIEQARSEATKRYAAALASYPHPARGKTTNLLYDPALLTVRQDDVAGTGTVSPLVDIKAFPKLLAAGEDDRMDAHHSYEIAQALSDHSSKMSSIEEELAKLKKEDKAFQGYSSADLAKAFQEYASKHKGQGLPQNFVVGSTEKTGAGSGGTGKTTITALAAGSSLGGAVPATMTLATGEKIYSWASLLHSMDWARVLYTIVWIVTGLFLLFFGYASLFWLHKLGLPGRQQSVAAGLAEALPGINSKKRGSSGRRARSRTILGGGVGGVLVGFLFFSYLAAVINNAICVDDGKKTLAAGAYFAVWLAPGLLGAVIGGHFALLTRAMAGILGGTAFTIILTAMFGIRTLLIRAILIAIFTVLLTAPLVQPRAKVVQMLILNACTSLIGMVTFLNGVALVAPSVEPSSNWLDLWTVLFMHDDATSKDVLVDAWGTSVFKGYIAGAVLGSVFGFVFELIFHRRCGHDPESEWNQYLGTYTQHMEGGATAYDDPAKAGAQARAAVLGSSSRAGMFEPAPSAWQRMVDFFDSESARPAHYGNLSGDGSLMGSSVGEKIRRKRSTRSARTARGGPARFEALSKRDDDHSDSSDDEKHHDQDDDDDDDMTEFGSDDGKRKDGEARDTVAELSKESPASINYGGYALPRPPLLSTNTNASSGGSSNRSRDAGSGDSRLTGTTAKDSNAGDGSAQRGSRTSSNDVHKPAHIYRDGAASPPLPAQQPASASPASVPATPSLIHAISRIQLAQQQARVWQQQHDTHGDPYPAARAASPPAKR